MAQWRRGSGGFIRALEGFCVRVVGGWCIFGIDFSVPCAHLCCTMDIVGVNAAQW